METRTITVYQFHELGERAKDLARDEMASAFGYAHSAEAIKSITKLAERFNAKITRYEVDWFDCSYSSMTFDVSELEPETIAEIVEQLGAFNPETLKGLGDCVLTGWCSDESAIDGLRIAYHAGERDVEKLLQAAFRSWLSDCQADCKAEYDDEQFGEMCDANDYWFTADGKLFHDVGQGVRRVAS